MVEISENLLSLYTAEIASDGETFTIEVPKRDVENGPVNPGEVHRVAVLPMQSSDSTVEDQTNTIESQEYSESPPVDAGDVVNVEVETLGDQGDGIARVGPGYVIIVPETEVGDRVSVRIEEANENVAFAEVVDRRPSRNFS